jgi:hypothetical protein
VNEDEDETTTADDLDELEQELEDWRDEHEDLRDETNL